MLAACYTRSSKDRADISLSAQSQELEALAKSRNLKIVTTYEDAVQSGSTDDRPAFQKLIADIKNPQRGWSILLVYDTSRIARGRYIAQAFRHECRRRGVELIIARMPETDPVSAVILEAVLEAMDEVHSIMSREKGLAGMRENVRRGWRAGGRAPWGYQLLHEPTGAVRDGKPVLKSKLIPAANAEQVRSYLTDRALGISRTEAMSRHDVDLNATTLIGVEWNALVYAGHTIWNRHETKKARGTGKPKRRDRAKWMIQPNTHVALITDSQAESILVQLETSDIGRAVSRAKTARSNYLLAGVLVTSDGRSWVGAGDNYRLKPRDGKRGRRVSREQIEQAVIARIRRDLISGELVQSIVNAARAAEVAGDRAKPVRIEIEKLNKQHGRAARLALESESGGVYLQLVEELGRKIKALQHEAAAIAAEDRATAAVREITPNTVREAILGLENDRALITALVTRVILEPDLSGQIEYGPLMASPGRADRWAPVHSTNFQMVA